MVGKSVVASLSGSGGAISKMKGRLKTVVQLADTSQQGRYGADDDSDDELERPPPRTVVDTFRYNMVTFLIIVVNVLIIGVEMDASECFVEEDLIKETKTQVCTESGLIFALLEGGFLLIFTGDLGLRLYYHGWKRFKPDWMNWVDAFLIFGSGLDLVLVAVKVEVLSALRAVRIVRVVRLIRFLRKFKKLYMIVEGFADAMKTILFSIPVIALMNFTFAVVITILIGKVDDEDSPYDFSHAPWTRKDYFGDVGGCMFTLMQVMTLDEWATNIVRPLWEVHWYWGLIFTLYILLMRFGVLNVIVAVVCDTCIALSRQNDDIVKSRCQNDLRLLLESLKQTFTMARKQEYGADGNMHGVYKKDRGSENIKFDNFCEQLNKVKVVQKFSLCDIPVGDAEELFNILDVDQSGDITWDEFREGCMQITGPARGEMLHALSKWVRGYSKMTTRFETRMKSTEGQLERMVSRLDKLYASYFDPCKKITAGPVLELVRTKLGGPGSPVSAKHGYISLADHQWATGGRGQSRDL